jgi:hypothetical protein
MDLKLIRRVLVPHSESWRASQRPAKQCENGHCDAGNHIGSSRRQRAALVKRHRIQRKRGKSGETAQKPGRQQQSEID